jgi:hypothetical protein
LLFDAELHAILSAGLQLILPVGRYTIPG